MSSQSRDEIDEQLLLRGRAPLPEEKYPRSFEKRVQSGGYYVAMGLVLSVWMITPLSCAYLVYFTLLGHTINARTSLTGTIFAAYALTEVVFAIYTQYLIRFVQSPSPQSNLSMEVRNGLVQRVYQTGLSYLVPTLSPNLLGDPGLEIERNLYSLYETGQVSAAQYHHLKDREYEEIHGMRSRPRVGKLTVEETGIIDAFVEVESGERDARLRAQVEEDVGVREIRDEEGILGKDGEVLMLHRMDRRAVEFRERFRTWFNHAPWETIRQKNMLIWLAWACLGISYEEALTNPKWSEFLHVSLGLLEARTGGKFAEGFNPDIQVIRLTLDPVIANGRPLLMYALSAGVNWFLRQVVYPHQGMSMYREGDVEYLVRIPQGWTPERGKSQPNALPVVYLHGLGFGLLQSHLLIKHLISSLPSHPILIPIFPHTAQAFFHERYLRPLTRLELVEAMKNICMKWGFWEPADGHLEAKGGISLMSHSNGSVPHGWIIKDCPSLAKRSTFVDPVVFCLWEGDVCHSFCYRKPTTALELLLYYFISTELGIAHYIFRHFDWADNTLWFDEIPYGTDPSRTAFFLGGSDIIIDAARVRRYLEYHGVKDGLHWDAKAGHGDGLSGAARDRVVMFAGTGSTTGWEGWLARGRRTHMREVDEWNLDKERIRHSGDFMDTLDKREDSDQTDLEDWDKEE